MLKYIQVSPFFVFTTAALWVLTYSFAHKQTGAVIRVSHSEVINHMPDAIVIVDKDNEIVDYNPAFKRLLDVSDCDGQELAGQQLDSYLPGQPWTDDAFVTRQTNTGVQHLEIKVKRLQQANPLGEQKVRVRNKRMS